jgi:hypothetical protein
MNPTNYFKIIMVALMLVLAHGTQAQNLPKAWHFSTDGHRLIAGNKITTTGLYDSTTVRSLYLSFPQTNYWTLLGTGYTAHTDLLANLMVDSVLYDSVGVRFKGMTSYSQVPGQKKSFNISLDFVHPNQDLIGYRTLNLNNSFGDPSFLRDVFYLHQIQKHIPASRANFVHLYINNQDWGLYPNIQQINKDFLSEWYLSNNGANFRADKPPGTAGGGGGGWGDGTAALNYFADTTAYKTKYTLKSSDAVPLPWLTLKTVCDKLNNTPVAQLPLILPDYLDIDRTLWVLASEIAFSDDDSYVYKGKMDYYTYYEPETGRFVPQEYDGNSVMQTSRATWSAFYNATNANYPLLNKLLNVPEWRQRYLAHLRTIINDELNTANCNAMLDNYKNQIDAMVQADPKKLSTYAQFTTGVNDLKTFVNTRRNSLLANAEVAQVAPIITNAKYTNTTNTDWGTVQAAQTTHATANITHASGVFAATLYYATGLVGNFAPTPMYDDGAHNDGAAADGIFGADIPAQIAGTQVRFYIQATANNTSKSVSYMPTGAEHDVFTYWIAPVAAAAADVVINEIMASNTTTAADNVGEYDDWIELYNKSNQSIDLSGWYITDNPKNNLDKFRIPQGTTIPPNGYMVFWADEDSIQGIAHLNFKLAASGETLWLLNAAAQLVDSLSFGVQNVNISLARVPNGTGNFVAIAPSFAATNNSTTTSDVSVSAISVYPNPAKNTLNVLISNIENKNKMQITNTLGSIIYDAPITQNHNIIDTQTWAAGVYVLRVGGQVQRIVIAK